MIDDDRTDDGRAMRRRRPGRVIAWSILAVLLVAALVITVVVAVRMPRGSTDLAEPPTGSLRVAADARGQWQVGDFSVRLDDGVRVTHADAAVPVWATPDGESFLTAGVGDPLFEDDYGLVRVSDRLERVWTDQEVTSAAVGPEGALVLGGTLTGVDGVVPWELRLEQGTPQRLDATATVGGRADRLYLSASLDADESVHGFGAQSTWDQRGRRVALLPREQGIGRGEQPVSFLVDLAARAAGGEDTTTLVSAVNVTDRSRSIAYRGDSLASVDLRPHDRMVWEVWSGDAAFSIAAAATPAEAVAVQTTWTGAAAPPPAWASTGLIAGLQGGTNDVRAKLATLQEAETPIAAVWLQDWVGQRTTDFGQRLQWNWSLDAERYPEWDVLVAELREQGIRVLTYVNPSLSADSGRAAADHGGRDLFAEAAALGYLARDADGGVLESDQHGFSAATVDLSDDAAREWLAQVIADAAVATGASGWMADFAEGPPPDARLAGGLGEQWRARWPVLWQQVNARALELSGLGADGFVWHRSGGSLSAGAADALWMGDQTQDWSAQDGLRSAVTIAQSLSASGMAQVHGDIGGYTSVDLPLVADVVRDDELLVRWAEASVLQPVFRTHEGNRPDAAAQPAEDPAVARRIAKLARLFAALAPERARLAATGPLALAVQHPWMMSPDDPLLRSAGAGDQLQLGPDLLLVPALQPGAESVAATLPPGRWMHVWTGGVYGTSAGVTRSLVQAPLGRPALFARVDSDVARELSLFVAAENERG